MQPHGGAGSGSRGNTRRIRADGRSGARSPLGQVYGNDGGNLYLNYQMARAMVRGFQKDLPDGRGVAACVKHFAAYGQAEAGRDYNTTDMSEQTLRDYYLPAYRAAVEEGQKW
mgnify:FL=1